MPPEVEQRYVPLSISIKREPQSDDPPWPASRVNVHPSKRTVVPMTPSKLTVHPVSDLDSILGNFYLHTVLYFDRSTMNVKGSWESDMEELNFSLSKILDLFPVLSGRLRLLDSGKLGIKSNDSGVRLTEATSTCSLKDWLDESDGTVHQQMIPDIRITDYSVSPLCTVQYTNFRCGSLAIGVSWCHVLADLFSMDLFLKLWGEAHRNGGRLHSPLASFTINNKALAERHHQQLPEPFDGKVGDDISIKVGQLESRVFHLSSKSVEKVMHESGAPEVESVCALIWKSAVRAQAHTSSTSRLCLWMSSKPDKMNRAYFGNAATVVKMVDAGGELAAQSTKEIARLVRVGETSSKGPSSFFSKNVIFCNWSANISSYDTEFAFSKPVYVESYVTSLFGEGLVTVAPGPQGGRSKSVFVSLEKEAMKRLLQDGEFASATAPSHKINITAAPVAGTTISAPAA